MKLVKRLAFTKDLVGKQEIKNLKKAAERIKKAVKNRERIILYGDSDLDGIGSVIILKETIQNLGGSVESIYFPHRETEDHGINKKALGFLKNHAPALFIAMDCGITNFEEVDLAKKLGFEVIIIDHHRILNKLPNASIIVDPHQPQDRSSFKDFATVGIAFKLAKLLLGTKLTPCLKNNFLELTALATLADMMPHLDENLEFLEQGLNSLKTSFRPGLQVFSQIGFVQDNVYQFAQKMIPVCHAATGRGRLNECYLLLTSSSLKDAQVLVEKLLEKAEVRYFKIMETIEEVRQRILRDGEHPVIFEGSEFWGVLTLGTAASKICQQYKKPVFLYSKKGGESRGAVRTPPEISGVKAMIFCSKFIESFGGHHQAAGFKIKNKNLEKFKKCLIEYFSIQKQ